MGTAPSFVLDGLTDFVRFLAIMAHFWSFFLFSPANSDPPFWSCKLLSLLKSALCCSSGNCHRKAWAIVPAIFAAIIILAEPNYLPPFSSTFREPVPNDSRIATTIITILDIYRAAESPLLEDQAALAVLAWAELAVQPALLPFAVRPAALQLVLCS